MARRHKYMYIWPGAICSGPIFGPQVRKAPTTAEKKDPPPARPGRAGGYGWAGGGGWGVGGGLFFNSALVEDIEPAEHRTNGSLPHGELDC